MSTDQTLVTAPTPRIQRSQDKYPFLSYQGDAPTVQQLQQEVEKIQKFNDTDITEIVRQLNAWGEGAEEVQPDLSIYARQIDLLSLRTAVSKIQAGDGDVSGPNISVDGHMAVFDGTTGKLIKDGGVAGMPNPMLALGDIISEDGTPQPVRVAGNTLARRKWLSQKGTGAVSALPSWQFVPVYNLDDYGVDPTGTNDSSIGYNAAMSDLNASSIGGKIVWPPGTFKISNVLTTANKSCLIEGAGQNITVLSYPGTFKGLIFDFTSAATQCTCAVRSLTMISANTGSTNFTGIYLRQINNANLAPPSQTSIQDVDLLGYWNFGIQVDNVAGNNSQVGTISNVNIFGYAGLPTGTIGVTLAGATGMSLYNVQVIAYETGFLTSSSPNCEGVSFIKCSAVNVNIGYNLSGANAWLQDCFCNVSAAVGAAVTFIGFKINANQCFVDNCYCLGGITTTKCFYFNGTYNTGTNLMCLSAGTRFGYGLYIDAGCNANCVFSDCILINTTTNAVFLANGSTQNKLDNIGYNDCIGTLPIANNGTSNYITNQRGFGSNANVQSLGNMVEGPLCGAKAMVRLTANQSVASVTTTRLNWLNIATDDSNFGFFTLVNAGSFVVGQSYQIAVVGTTSFTSIGASVNTVGIGFVATGVGSGSGSAYSLSSFHLPPGTVKVSLKVDLKLLATGSAGAVFNIFIEDQSGNVLASGIGVQDTSGNNVLCSAFLQDFDISFFTSVTDLAVIVYHTAVGSQTIIGSTGVGAHHAMISITR